MSFRRSDLQEAFFVPGTHAFRVWGYGTADRLEDVLAPGYFTLARGLLRAGELIYVHVRPRPGRGGEAEAGAPGMALVMAQAAGDAPEAASGSVRLVQEFGRACDRPGGAGEPALAPAAAPVKRGRGRPPGSRNKKPAPATPVAGASQVAS